MATVYKLERIETDKNRSTTSPKRSVYFINELGLQIKASTKKDGNDFPQNLFFTGESLKQLRDALDEIDKLNNK